MWHAWSSCPARSYSTDEHEIRQFWDPVSSDLHGPLPPSHGSKYVCDINFVGYTGLIDVHGLTDKTSEATAQVLQTFLGDTAHIDRTTTTLTDGGTEFMGERMGLCLNQQQEHRIAAAYYHDGDGKAERAWRTLLSKTRAMLHNARLGWRHWFQALRRAAWIHDRTTDWTIDTPLQRAYGVVADLLMARAWGYLALAYRPDAQQHREDGKLGRRATWATI